MNNKIGPEIFKDEIHWKKGPDTEFVYECIDKNWKIRINDFPEEVMFTLFIDNEPTLDFDDWPEYWDRP